MNAEEILIEQEIADRSLSALDKLRMIERTKFGEFMESQHETVRLFQDWQAAIQDWKTVRDSVRLKSNSTPPATSG